MFAFTQFRPASPVFRLPGHPPAADPAGHARPAVEAGRRRALVDAGLLIAGLLAGLFAAQFSHALPTAESESLPAVLAAPPTLSSSGELATGLIPPQTFAAGSAARQQQAVAQAAALKDVLDDLAPALASP